MTRKKYLKRPEVGPESRNANGHIIYGHTTGVYIDNDKYPLDWANCGTRSNYKAHMRRGQEACSKCAKAEGSRMALQGERVWKRV